MASLIRSIDTMTRACSKCNKTMYVLGLFSSFPFRNWHLFECTSRIGCERGNRSRWPPQWYDILDGSFSKKLLFLHMNCNRDDWEVIFQNEIGAIIMLTKPNWHQSSKTTSQQNLEATIGQCLWRHAKRCIEFENRYGRSDNDVLAERILYSMRTTFACGNWKRRAGNMLKRWESFKSGSKGITLSIEAELPARWYHTNLSIMKRLKSSGYSEEDCARVYPEPSELTHRWNELTKKCSVLTEDGTTL